MYCRGRGFNCNTCDKDCFDERGRVEIKENEKPKKNNYFVVITREYVNVEKLANVEREVCMERYDYYITDEHYNIAKTNGIKSTVLRDRVYVLGWNINRAINQKAIKMSTVPEEIEKNLIKNNINRKTYLTRVHRGWDMVKASTTPILSGKERAKRAVEARDKKAKFKASVYKDIITKNNLSIELVRERIYKRGWSIEKAINTPKVDKKNNKNHYWRKIDNLIYNKS